MEFPGPGLVNSALEAEEGYKHEETDINIMYIVNTEWPINLKASKKGNASQGNMMFTF